MTFEELFADSSSMELGKFAIIVFGMPFVVMVFLTFAFRFFVGLRADPDKRAFLTVLPAYVITTLLFVFGISSLGAIGILFPIACIPVALLLYWWFKREFRASWVDDEMQLPDGTRLENRDWKIGLGAFVALMIAATIKVMLLHAR